MNKTNTCIIFDMDGTLWDASDNIAAAYNALLHEQRGWDGYCTGDDLRAVAGMRMNIFPATAACCIRMSKRSWRS